MAVRHHGDSLLKKAAGALAGDYYFIKETRAPRVAWRFMYVGEFDPDEERYEDPGEMAQYI